ncbi:MAG: DUF4158 domain-containing protein, partial [Cyanobacteria bacterium J06648_11]
MPAVDRTAYPRFNLNVAVKDWEQLYAPTEEELAFVRDRARSKSGVLSLLVMLKSVQRLGYFPASEDVPSEVVNYLRAASNLPSWTAFRHSPPSRHRYQRAIRSYLKIAPYDRKGQRLAAKAIATVAEVNDRPADLINVAIEVLVKERYELPAFSTLNLLAREIRLTVNQRLFRLVSRQMSQAERTYLDRLLAPASEQTEATLDLLRSSPKRASLSHLRELLEQFDRLMAFGEAQRILTPLTPAKIRSFAAQARGLNAGEFKDIALPKRRTFLLCLLYRAQVKTRDHLVEMFLKQVNSIHKKARNRLKELRERYLSQTESMFGIFSQVLSVSTQSDDERELGEQVKAVLDAHGGAETLLAQCEELSAYNTNNHLPLLWRFYAPHRRLLFQLVRSLDLRSTSPDRSSIEAVEYLLSCESLRRRVLPATIDVSFISEAWRALVCDRQGEEDVLVRQPLEICLFSYLAMELKSGDICVVGSDSYADFRQQLLSWDDCAPLLEDYARQVELPSSPELFVAHLREQLVRVAREADRGFPANTQLT